MATNPVLPAEHPSVFPLTYYTDHGPRDVDAYMLHHRPSRFDDRDVYTVHEASTGKWLGWGESKDDSITYAQIALHQRDDFGIPVGRD